MHTEHQKLIEEKRFRQTMSPMFKAPSRQTICTIPLP